MSSAADSVAVTRGEPADASACLVRTRHFAVERAGDRRTLRHRFHADELDNDIAGILDEELFRPGWLRGSAAFEQVFADIVRSTPPDASSAWRHFYANTLDAIRRHLRGDLPRTRSTIAGFAPVYAEAQRLVDGERVLDLGSCFGFFPLLLAERGDVTVLAADHTPGAMELLEAQTSPRRAAVRTLVCDAARVPLPDRSVDTVTVLHLLEHLTPEHGAAVVREALRLATRRVVIAVPFEDVPNATFGHVRRFDTTTLEVLGRWCARPYTVSEHHGGWLVLDNTSGGRADRSPRRSHVARSA